MTLVNPFAEPAMPKIKITPMQDGQSLLWQCKCKAHNELLKSEISENKAYICGNCGEAWVLGRMPDDMRHWLNSKEQLRDIDVRPRITKW